MDLVGKCVDVGMSSLGVNASFRGFNGGQFGFASGHDAL